MSVALPTELDFSLPASLPDNRSYELRTQPTNGASFASQSVIQVSLPILQRSFYESNTMYLTGRMTLDTATTVIGTAYMNPAGVYGLFSRMTVRSSQGQTLDDIQQPGVVANVLLNAGLTATEARACANHMLLNERGDFSNLGLQIGTALPGQAKIIDFAMPMLGLLNMTKYLPAYGTEIVIELTVNTVAGAIPVLFDNGTTPAAITGATMALSNIELVSQVLEFSPSAFSIVQQQYPEKIVLKSETYSYGSNTLAASTSGAVDIPFNIRCNSLKRLFMSVAPATAVEKIYAGVNPNANSISFVNNGIVYPQRPVQASRPAECFAQFLKAFGGLYSSDKSSQISIAGWRRASTAYVTGVYGAFNATVADALTVPNKFFFCIDLEALSNHKDAMYNGVNTSGTSSNYIRIDIGTALAAASHTVSYFSCHDVLLNIDLVSGIVSTIV